MFKSALANRLTVAKSIGFVIGFIGFFILPSMFGETDLFIRWGIVFWYTTLGAIIGIFGILTKHPVLNFSMPFWVRGTILGAWLNFVLVLFIYDKFTLIMQNTAYAGLSPFWLVLEGAIVGLIIDFVATKYVGEGERVAK